MERTFQGVSVENFRTVEKTERGRAVCVMMTAAYAALALHVACIYVHQRVNFIHAGLRCVHTSGSCMYIHVRVHTVSKG